MKFVILGVLIVVLIGFLVVVWKARGEWRWYHLLSVVLVMFLTCAFIFPVAGVAKSRQAWHQVKEKLESRAEKAVNDQKELKYGSAEDVGGVLALSQELAKISVEAGRVWRGLQMQTNTVNTVTLIKPQDDTVVPPELAAGEEGAEAAPAINAPLIPKDLVVYGYAEGPQPGAEVPIPVFYLGEFRVTQSAPDRITVVPTTDLEPEQQQAIKDRKASRWSLYELLPLDGHKPFIALGSKPSADNLFGRVDEDLVKRLFGNERVDAKTLEHYLRDGTRSVPDDPPSSRWTKIEFTKKHKIEVDSPEQRGALDGGFFDGNGRAVDSRLQRNEDNEVAFSVGDQIVVKEEAADQLIDEGVAKLIDTFYVRPLNDYRYVLRNIRTRLTQLATREEELEFAKAVLEEAIRATNSMITTNQEAKLKLEQDFNQIEIEGKAITTYHDELAAKVKSTQQEVVRLYCSNQTLEAELTRIHDAIQTRMNVLTTSVR